MAEFNSDSPDTRAISPNTFAALRATMGNLFRYGVFGGLDMTVLQSVSYPNHAILAKEPNDNDIATHVYSGTMLYREDSVTRGFEVWTRMESLPVKPWKIKDDTIEPATLLRMAFTHTGERIPRLLQSMVTSVDGRVFFGSTSRGVESSTRVSELKDDAASRINAMLAAHVPYIAESMVPRLEALREKRQNNEDDLR